MDKAAAMTRPLFTALIHKSNAWVLDVVFWLHFTTDNDLAAIGAGWAPEKTVSSDFRSAKVACAGRAEMAVMCWFEDIQYFELTSIAWVK
ncbi:hypothetical protein [Marinobacter changyiensis]|uniref:hypothetical protein n=1 Tax=Marinobacter changyiensis TaxID=2604091 RepID=UPI0015D36744|nr:hypothetical protein [Marinobacter changyiensis]